MKHITLLITLSIFATACKKNDLTINSSEPVKSDGRYYKEIFSAVKADSNILYGTALNIRGLKEDLLMDVYEPADDVARKRAMIIFVHGGGWVASGKNEGKEFCTSFAKKGYVTASIDYRLGIEYPINDKTRGEAVYRGVQDIKAAIRYVRSNASLFKIDTGQIFIGGYSAGAVNAVHAAYWDENEVPQNIDKERWGSLNGSGNDLNISSDAQVVYSIAGCIGDTGWIQSGEPPIVCVHTIPDPFIPYNSGRDYLGIYEYGATAMLQRANSLNIPATVFTYQDIWHDAYLNPVNFTTTTNAINYFLYTRINWQK
jgi:acetyl esterase/lipase